jgi:hypothetical protein
MIARIVHLSHLNLFPFQNTNEREINCDEFDEIHEFNEHAKMLTNDQGQSQTLSSSMSLSLGIP